MPRTNIDIFLTLILSGIATIFEQYGLIWFLVICTLCLESITYYMAAKAKGRKIRTNKKRILKVTSQIVSLLFGLLLDALEAYLISHSNDVLGITFKASIPFGIIICVYIILSESINILNNLNASGAHFPPIVIRFLKTLKEKISEVDLSISDAPSLDESVPITVPANMPLPATEPTPIVEPIPDTGPGTVCDKPTSPTKELETTQKSPVKGSNAKTKALHTTSSESSSDDVKTLKGPKSTNKSIPENEEGENDNA